MAILAVLMLVLGLVAESASMAMLSFGALAVLGVVLRRRSDRWPT